MGGAGCDPKEGDVIFATAFRAASATTTLTLLTELRQGRRIYAATDTVGLRKSWPSRHIANRMRAKRRAPATTATRLPRRAARRCIHSRKARPAGPRVRHSAHVACTNIARVSVDPALVIGPLRCRSPELASRGTRPR